MTFWISATLCAVSLFGIGLIIGFSLGWSKGYIEGIDLGKDMESGKAMRRMGYSKRS